MYTCLANCIFILSVFRYLQEFCFNCPDLHTVQDFKGI
jgi:hypothetical protein